jgi:hypothetical protein
VHDRFPWRILIPTRPAVLSGETRLLNPPGAVKPKEQSAEAWDQLQKPLTAKNGNFQKDKTIFGAET